MSEGLTKPLHESASGTQTQDEPDDFAAGAVLGRYAIVKRIGSGGAGTVYRAFDEVLDRDVALKLLESVGERGRNPTVDPGWSKLVREARMLAKLDADEVVTVFDVGEIDGRAYLAMELVRGGDLADWFTRHRGAQAEDPRALDEALELTMQAARGLAAAHEAGLVHGDFKPANVLIDGRGRAKVSDFGIARRHGLSDPPRGQRGADPEAQQTHPSAADAQETTESNTATGPRIVGTPAFMAPEQFDGEPASVRSDIYAFGTTLFIAAYAELPFRGKSIAQLVERKLRGAPERPRSPRAPRWLHAVIERCLAPRPDDRYADLGQVLTAVDQGRRRNGRLAMAGIGAVALTGAAAAFVMASQATDPLCDPKTAPKLEWNDETRTQLQTALAEAHPETPDRVATTFEAMSTSVDDYAERWKLAYGQVCDQLGALEESGLAPRAFSCLRRRRAAAETIISGWQGGTKIDLARASTAIAHLNGPERCTSVEDLSTQIPLPDDEVLRARVEQLRDDVARARGLVAVGSFDEALELGQRTLDDARGTSHSATISEAAAALGQAMDHLGDYAGARKAMEESYFAARDSEHHEAEALASEQLTFIVGVRLEDYEEGLLWAKNAKVALSKSGGPRGKLLGNEASILDRKGDFAGAIKAYQEALDALQEEGADGHAIGVTHMRLADTLRAHGQHEDAITHYRETVKLWRETFGDDHPYVPISKLSLATGLSAAGRSADAIPVFRQAIDAMSSVLGEDHPNVGVAYINLGIALRKTGDLKGAKAAQVRSVEITRKAFGDDHRKTGQRLDALGRTLAALGDVDGAIASHTEAISIFDKSLQPGHPDRLLARLNLADDLRQAEQLADATQQYERAWSEARQHADDDVAERWMAATYFGRALVERGEFDRAAPVLERALEHLSTMEGFEDVDAVASFAMARILWRDPQTRTRALQLAQSARGQIPDDREARALEAWLERPGRPTPHRRLPRRSAPAQR